MDLGRIGVWSGALRADEARVAEGAGELGALGFGALWIPGGGGGDIFEACGRLLAATQRVVVATGIVNIWAHEPADVAGWHARLDAAHHERFLLGLGVSHGPMVERLTRRPLERPVEVMATYLDALDAAVAPVPVRQRVLAALGPRMLDLAAARSAGAHPYLVTPEHTAIARQRMGPDALIATEQKVVLDTDPATARELARANLTPYLGLPNYTNNLRRLGFGDDDLAGGGSDRLVDALVVCGDVEAVGHRVQEHLDAGADHVCLQLLDADRRALPMEGFRRLAALVPRG